VCSATPKALVYAEDLVLPWYLTTTLLSGNEKKKWDRQNTKRSTQSQLEEWNEQGDSIDHTCALFLGGGDSHCLSTLYECRAMCKIVHL